MMRLHQRLVTRFFSPTNRTNAELFEVQSKLPGNIKRKSVIPPRGGNVQLSLIKPYAAGECLLEQIHPDGRMAASSIIETR
jgi:hypothetical protein